MGLSRLAVPVAEFNARQDTYYAEYVAECEANGVPAAPFERYFYKFDKKYGYVYQNAAGNEVTWKRRKQDFD
jgi:hypothetical protein